MKTNILIVISIIALSSIIFLKEKQIEKIESENQSLKSEIIVKKEEIEKLSINVKELSTKLVNVKKHYYESGQLKSEESIVEESNQKIDQFLSDKLKLSESYEQLISDMAKEKKEKEVVKIPFRFNMLAVYDSERGLEYEANTSYGLSAFSVGYNPKGYFRAGLGFGF